MTPVLHKILEYPIFGFNFARFLHFKSQHAFLNLFISRLPWVDRKLVEAATQNGPLTGLLLKELTSLLKQDAQNIATGVYPVTVLKPERLQSHFMRFPLLIWDGIKIYNRRVKKLHQSFSLKAQQHLHEVPEYFRRNYHFQTDGYLSEHSAELYEHQVELLFSGAGDAMRRILLKPLKERLGDAQGKKFLEVACGTGRMTRFMNLTFPQSNIVATDVSSPYLQVAKRKLSDLSRVDFLQTDAAQLPFKDQSFDVVYSIFLFHELPLEVRQQVIGESYRVLKPGGLLALVDSVQIKDFEEIKEALDQFPVNFHEPFYKNYIQNSMEAIFKDCGFQSIETGRGFLSKFVIGEKAI